jgi:RNA polymerase sigma-70 factor, ECF subfamily
MIKAENNQNSEAALVRDALAGDKQALTQIVRLNERMVYNAALRMLSDPVEAECVLQETFLKVFQALPDFKGNSSLSTWIFRIATNYALMRLRSLKRNAGSIDDEETKVSAGALAKFNDSIGNNPLAAVMNEELKAAMDQAINDLPPKFRSVFVMKDIEGLALKEISDTLDISLAAVKSNLHRARLFLRNRLAGFTENRYR